MRRLFLVMLSFFILSACSAARQAVIRPPLDQDGEVLLYLKPLPQNASRLTLVINSVSAVRDDGTRHPLELAYTELKGYGPGRERLFAQGKLPPGNYTGFDVGVKDAFLKEEEGRATLLFPKGPTLSAFPFKVERKKASLFTMDLRYSASIKNEVNFSPFFVISPPPRPLAGVVGYVSDYGSNDLTVFDKTAKEPVGIIALGRGPRGLALDQQARRLYAAVSGEDEVDIIDLKEQEIINRIKLRPGDSPSELALTPDGKTLLSANPGSDTVSIMDPAQLIETARINVGKDPHWILMDRTGLRAYVLNRFSNSVSVIDIANKALVTTIFTEAGPIRAQFSSRGDRLYLIYDMSPYMTVMDTSTFGVLNRIKVGMGASFLKVDPITDLIYLGKKGSGSIEIYNPFSLLPVDYVDTGVPADFIAIDGEENAIYSLSEDGHSVVVNNLIGKQEIGEFDVGSAPYWIVLMGER